MTLRLIADRSNVDFSQPVSVRRQLDGAARTGAVEGVRRSLTQIDDVPVSAEVTRMASLNSAFDESGTVARFPRRVERDGTFHSPQHSSSPAEIDFLGVKLANLDDKQAANAVAERPLGAPFAYVVTPNAAHFSRLASKDSVRFRDAYDHAWLRLMDGQIPRALARVFFKLDIPLATGSDVVMELLNNHILPDDAVTVIGSTEELRAGLVERFGLRNLAFHVPPRGFINDEVAVAECVEFVRANPAQYVFFAVGAPQSEYLARAVQARGGVVGTGLCIGSALLFAAGLVRRAPAFFRRNGLEWLYRLMLNPFGHARRIFVESLPIFLVVLRAKFAPETDVNKITGR